MPSGTARDDDPLAQRCGGPSTSAPSSWSSTKSTNGGHFLLGVTVIIGGRARRARRRPITAHYVNESRLLPPPLFTPLLPHHCLGEARARALRHGVVVVGAHAMSDMS